MEVQYLIALIALLLAVWLVSSQIRSTTRNRLARQSREKMRNRVAARTLATRQSDSSQTIDQCKPREQEADATIQEANVTIQEANSKNDASVTPIDHNSAELKTLRNRLQEKDQTILQLQQVLDELSSTTATRESVNVLQKQLIASKAKVLQLEGELQQLKVEMGKRRAPVQPAPARSSVESEWQPMSGLSAQTNEAMKAQLADQLTHAEAKAEDTQQNALELRRLRSELDSMRDDRSSARTRIEELQIRLAAQQVTLDSETEQATLVNVHQEAKPLYATLDEKDDLKLIKGIGPVLEQRLNELGVTTFRQLAGFTDHDIERVSTAISAFPGRMEREDWVGKARKLLARRTHSA